MGKAVPLAAAVALAAALAGAWAWAVADPAMIHRMPTLAASAEAAPATAEGLPAPGCSGIAPEGTGVAPALAYEQGAVTGTSTDDLRAFALRFNEIRIAACLEPIPAERITWSACLEERLAWMAGDPSGDPASAWGHTGTARSDGAPSIGCDGNLAGGDGNSGATVAGKWWDSLPHRASLYRPGDDAGGACIGFAMTHGGVPDEPRSFTRAAAIWTSC